MKTAMIFNDCEELKYFCFDKDLSRLDGVYVNSSGGPLEDELVEFMYNALGQLRREKVSLAVFRDHIQHNQANIIECGFLP